jgi:hypothetical protein
MALLFQKVRGILGLASHPLWLLLYIAWQGVKLKLSVAETLRGLVQYLFWLLQSFVLVKLLELNTLDVGWDMA